MSYKQNELLSNGEVVEVNFTYELDTNGLVVGIIVSKNSKYFKFENDVRDYEVDIQMLCK